MNAEYIKGKEHAIKELIDDLEIFLKQLKEKHLFNIKNDKTE